MIYDNEIKELEIGLRQYNKKYKEQNIMCDKLWEMMEEKSKNTSEVLVLDKLVNKKNSLLKKLQEVERFIDIAEKDIMHLYFEKYKEIKKMVSLLNNNKNIKVRIGRMKAELKLLKEKAKFTNQNWIELED